MLHVGIDPGLYGALAVIDDSQPDDVLIFDIPTLDVGVGRTMAGTKKRKVVVDEVALARIFDAIAKVGAAHVTIEHVGVRPGEGAVGAFSFGRAVGLLLGMAHAHFMPISHVRPQEWRKAMGVKGDKDQSRLAAKGLFPKWSDLFELKKHDGRAEAALIAKYGERLRKGIVP